MSERRVVVTGMGLVTPLGVGVDAVWQRLMMSASGARRITKIDTTDLPVNIACEVPIGNAAPDFNANDWVPPKEQRRIDDFILFGLAAAEQALADAGWKPEDEESLLRTGVLVGSGIGGLPSIEAGAITMHDRGPRRISPFFIPGSLINLLPGNISIKYGFKGPNHAVVTACSTGAHAIGDAARMIKLDDADVMVAGGAEAAICRLGMAGFAACKALSTGFLNKPTRASRPYDKQRDGFVMGEGSGIVILEELEHAKARGAKIYAEVAGYGLSGDAHHITAPAPDGDGGYRSMKAALTRAELNPEEIDYVNAHGTSTKLNDAAETVALKEVFGDAVNAVPVSSSKSMFGHLIHAAGVTEAIVCIKSIGSGIITPTINQQTADPDCDLDYVPNDKRSASITYALSNSFGFGGTNAALLFKRYDG